MAEHGDLLFLLLVDVGVRLWLRVINYINFVLRGILGCLIWLGLIYYLLRDIWCK
jgi:hypothetical protein